MKTAPTTLKYKEYEFTLGGAGSDGDNVVLLYSAVNNDIIPVFKFEVTDWATLTEESMELSLQAFMNDFLFGFFKVVVAPVEAVKLGH